MQVIELRNYLLKAGVTGDFIRYFEEHFLFSQREEGMHLLGQFEVVDEPSRFVWIRGFEDMRTRLRGLDGFYGGAFWQAHRAVANEMMLEHHNVHLLRPLGSIADLTGGLALEDRASEPPGAIPAYTGLVVVDFYRSHPGKLDHLVELFERQMRPALVEHGHQILGHFVAELTPNDYPRLPVIQDPTILVTLSAYRDREHHAAMHGEWSDGAAWAGMKRGELSAVLAKDVETIRLRPTAKSLICYQSAGSRD
jgi:hypothetical protein